MAVDMDRSRYRNPDLPIGYVKKEAELRYTRGREINGVHYIWAPYIYDMHLEEREDYATLSDLIMTSDEECTIKATGKGHKRNTSALGALFSNINIEEKEAKKKKKMKIKKERERSNSSSSSSSHRHASPASSRKHTSPSRCKYGSPSSHRHRYISPRGRRHHSPSSHRHRSFSPIRKHHFSSSSKEELLEPPERHLNRYHCSTCNITMNSDLTYNTHLNGKKHRKNLKVKNVPEAVAASIPATVISEDQSKYPKIPQSVIRRKVQKPAKIQETLENMQQPCPGLNFVTEIQGICGIRYYCSLCDSVFNSSSVTEHLTGFNHQLKSVIQLKPDAYEHLQNEPKQKSREKMKSILCAVQRQEGMGRMAVEVEELVSMDEQYDSTQPPRDYRNIPSTSTGICREQSGMSFTQQYSSSTVPDISASDYFCEICQSHMNSPQTWEAHVKGKRHLTNLKKMPGDLPPKTKTTVSVPNKKEYILERIKHEHPHGEQFVDLPSKIKTTVPIRQKAYLLERIKHERPHGEPFVGLKEIGETKIHKTNSHSYQCFLCGSCHTSIDILQHVMSLKHRAKYLESINFPGRCVIDGMSDSIASNLVREMCKQVEANEGMGKPAVYVNKSSWQMYQ